MHIRAEARLSTLRALYEYWGRLRLLYGKISPQLRRNAPIDADGELCRELNLHTEFANSIEYFCFSRACETAVHLHANDIGIAADKVSQ